MADGVTLEDFRTLLRHLSEDAVSRLGAETANMQADAAAKGASGNGGLPLRYIEAAKREWRNLVNVACGELVAFEDATGIEKEKLIPVARELLEESLIGLREVSKVDAPAGARFSPGESAMRIYNQKWDELFPYLAIALRRVEIGMRENRPPQATTVYSIHAENISGQVQQGTRHSTQIQSISSETLFAKLETTVREEISDASLQSELLALVKELEAKKGTGGFKEAYQQFMSAAANHFTVFGPFLPALAHMIP